MQTQIYCPKCSADMAPLRRNGVVIERCTDCGGVFLDRGELEKIMAGERRSIETWDDDDDDYRDRDRDHYDRDDREYHGGRKKRRKRSFFEDIFDIG